MAMRSIGSLTISFGLVAIPVKLYTATQTANSISFNLLHKGCGSRLKQQYVCLKDGTTVERDDMVKGYEFSKDQYVQFSNEEIKAMEEIGTHSIDIAEFVPIESIDPVYFDKTYYLAPDKGGNKPYGLLNEALKDTKRCAIGRWAARGKSYLVALRPVGDVLTMQQLHFANEVRAATEVDVVKPDVKAPELKLAKQLIEQQTTEKFDPTAYVDDVRARVEAAIQKKVEGQEISIAEGPVETGGKVIDLMEALQASLDAGGRRRGSTRGSTKAKATKGPKRAGSSASKRPAAKRSTAKRRSA
jgi:DNA end-binding protein Ku